MRKKRALFIFGVMLIGISGSAAMALSPMGPPSASLQAGESHFGLEYEYSEMDLEAFGSVDVYNLADPPLLQSSEFRKYKIKNLKSNMIMGRVGTGLWDNWDVFLRLGVSDAQGDISEILANGTPKVGDQYKDFDSDFGFAWGAGTRATFYQEGNTAWGGLIQFTMARPDGSSIVESTDTTFTGDAEIKYWEIQVALGPTIELDTFRIYGGPFVQFVNGDLDIKGRSTAGGEQFRDPDIDIHEESQAGGYAGAQWYLGENSSLYTEVQFTGDVWGVGVGTVWKF